MLTLLSDLLKAAGYSDIANALILAVNQNASALQTGNKSAVDVSKQAETKK